MAAACCLGALPLLDPNPPATSDGIYHLLRAAELDRQLRAGVPYPRWAPDFYLGYGYPIFLFTPLLPYYLVELVHLAGPALPSALAAVEALALLASGLLAYAWLRRHVAPTAAAVGAALYALAPYHLVNLYYRGDLAEFLAAAWFPAILLALGALLRRPSSRRLLALGTALAALLLTHFLSALLFLPAAGLLALAGLDWRRPARLGRQVAAGLAAATLGAGLAAFAWLPALALAGDATFGKLLRFYDVGANFAAAGQLFSGDLLQRYTAVFAGAAGYGYQFGLLQGAALAAGLLAAGVGWRRLGRRRRHLAAAFALLAALSLLGCLRLAAPVWQALAPLRLVQFPWRLLAVAALPAAWFAALAVQAVPRRARGVAGAAACLLIAASGLAALRPPRLALPPDLTSVAGIARFELLYHLAGTSAAAEYLPPWAAQRQVISAQAFQLATGQAPPADPAADFSRWTPGEHQSFTLERAQAGEVVLPVLFFPGWTATVDGRPAVLHPAAGSGLAALALPAGRHTVALDFTAAPVVRLGDAVSLAAVLVVGLMAVAARHRRRHARTPDAATRAGRSAAASIELRGAAAALGADRGLGRNAPLAGVAGLARRGGPDAVIEAGAWWRRARRGQGGPAGRGRSALDGIRRRRAAGAGAALLGAPCCLALAVALVGGRGMAGDRRGLDATLAGGLHLAGAAFLTGDGDAAGEVRLPAGATLRLRVQATAPAGQRLAVRLTDGQETDWADWQTPLSAGATTLALPLPPALPPGLYVLRLGSAAPGRPADYALVRPGLLRLLPVDGTLLLGPLVVTPPSAPAGEDGLLVAVWPGRAGLAAPSLPPSLPAGGTLAATWTWRVAPTWRGERLTETLHLRDAAGHVLAAMDSEPAGGAFPTPFWSPGQHLLEGAALALPADTAPGDYIVTVGLRGPGGALPAQDAADVAIGDEATLGHLRVLPPATPAAWPGGGVPAAGLAAAMAQPVGEAVPGRPLHLALRWHLPALPAGADTVEARLVAGGRTVGAVTSPIGSSSFPVARWRPGETERQDLDLPVAGDASQGPAHLLLLLRSSTTAVGQVDVATVPIAGRPHIFTASPRTPLADRFAGGIALIGEDIQADGAPAAGTTVRARRSLDVTLYWRAAGPTSAPLKVTVQVLSASGALLAQRDTEPGDGAAPTTSWLAGEIVTSRHRLDLSGLPAGTDRLIAALYDPATGRRLTAAGGGGTVSLATVTVP